MDPQSPVVEPHGLGQAAEPEVEHEDSNLLNLAEIVAARDKAMTEYLTVGISYTDYQLWRAAEPAPPPHFTWEELFAWVGDFDG